MTSRYLQNSQYSLWLLYSCHCCDISKKPLTNHYSLGRGQCRQWGGGGGRGGGGGGDYLVPCKQCICIVIHIPSNSSPHLYSSYCYLQGDINTVLIYTWQASMNIWKWAFQCCGLVPQYTGKCAAWSTNQIIASPCSIEQYALSNACTCEQICKGILITATKCIISLPHKIQCSKFIFLQELLQYTIK